MQSATLISFLKNTTHLNHETAESIAAQENLEAIKGCTGWWQRRSLPLESGSRRSLR